MFEGKKNEREKERRVWSGVLQTSDPPIRPREARIEVAPLRAATWTVCSKGIRGSTLAQRLRVPRHSVSQYETAEQVRKVYVHHHTTGPALTRQTGCWLYRSHIQINTNYLNMYIIPIYTKS
jgi:hypothetical protein